MQPGTGRILTTHSGSLRDPSHEDRLLLPVETHLTSLRRSASSIKAGDGGCRSRSGTVVRLGGSGGWRFRGAIAGPGPHRAFRAGVEGEFQAQRPVT